MKGILLVGVVALACSQRPSEPTMPPEQQQYGSQTRALYERWKAESDNDIRRAKVEEEARSFLRTSVTASDWRAEVLSVQTTRVSAFRDHVFFELWPTAALQAEFDATAAELKQGDMVVFSGWTEAESLYSLDKREGLAEALKNPTLNVKATKFTKAIKPRQ